MIYSKYVKRGLDIVFSLLALIILGPVLVVIAILVRIKLGSPVLFRQARPGKNEKIFFLYKFRSMTNEVGTDGRLLPDQQRLTKFGKLLRASSLDELPELINILKGDMSIVGPRPLSIYYLPHYPIKFRQRHSVRPGLTGFAQVNGRNSVPWDERFSMDLEYVSNLSFLNDFKIIIKTGLKVLKHTDVSVRGTAKVQDYGPYCVLKEEGKVEKIVEGMTYSEIGSYFWLDGSEQEDEKRTLKWLPQLADSALTFSGRNAIDLVLRDIVKKKRPEVVYAPSYCCVSMLQSFIDRGMKVVFYNADYSDGEFLYDIPETDDKSIVLLMSYFGLDLEKVHKLIRKVHNTGGVVIEDITHSLLSDSGTSECSDYVVASLRKWFPIPTGGWCGKRTGVFSEKPNMNSNFAVKDKIKAMEDKYAYLMGRSQEKATFLLANAKFDNDLIHVDRMLKMDEFSLSILEHTDVDKVISARRNNAEVLINGLKDLDGVSLSMFQLDLDRVTPLFVPIYLETEKRDDLREYLIERGIYCPIHWPEVMGAISKIRLQELSLICDQRYTVKDMKVIVETIHEWTVRK